MNFFFTKTLAVILSTASAVSCATKPEINQVPETSKERGEVNYQILVGHKGEMDHCIRISRDEVPRGEAKAAFIWTIDPEGSVANLAFDSAKTTVQDPALLECMIAASKNWKFAQSKSGKASKVWYTYNFH